MVKIYITKKYNNGNSCLCVYVYSVLSIKWHIRQFRSVVDCIGRSLTVIRLVKYVSEVTIILNEILVVNETLILVVYISILTFAIAIIIPVFVIEAVIPSIVVIIDMTITYSVNVIAWRYWGLIVRIIFPGYLALVLEPVLNNLLCDSLWAGLRLIALFGEFFALLLIRVMIFNERFFQYLFQCIILLKPQVNFKEGWDIQCWILDSLIDILSVFSDSWQNKYLYLSLIIDTYPHKTFEKRANQIFNDNKTKIRV